MKRIIFTILITVSALASASSPPANKAEDKHLPRTGYPEYVTFLPSEKLDSVLDFARNQLVPVIHKVNEHKVQSNPTLDSVVAVINRIELDPNVNMAYVWVGGSSSPDGPEKLNNDLARLRARALAEYLRKHTGLKEEDLHVVNLGEDWSAVERRLLELDYFPQKEKIIYIITNEPDISKRKQKIQKLDGGRSWRRLIREVFAPFRNSRMVIVCTEEDPPATPYLEITENVTEVEEPELEEVATEPAAAATAAAEDCGLHAYVKTNMPAWLMLWINAAAEFDFAHHWSATLPIYYAGYNYMRSDLKWRLFALQPEVRYWPNRCNKGFFVGAHFGLAWYNCAFRGEHRYQDHDGDTPAVGGGVSLGYRFCVSKNKRWWIEASVGAGVYRLDYDIFANTHNGLLLDRRKRTFFGVDNAALSISYQFDMKGGRKR